MADTTDLFPARNQSLKKEKVPITPLKSSTEILSELFGQFNAKPPEISTTICSVTDKYEKKPKKKKKLKEKKKKKSDKRGRSSSDDSDVELPRKKSKKSKRKKHKKRSQSSDSENGYVKKSKRSYSPDSPLPKNLIPNIVPKEENERKVTLDTGNVTIQVNNNRNRVVNNSPEEIEDIKPDLDVLSKMDHIPIPKTPDVSKIKLPDEIDKADKCTENSDKSKAGINKIQIKNLKFSSVFEANVKQAEEEARKKAEKYEDGELSSETSLSSAKAPSDDSDTDIAQTPDLREKLNHLARCNSENETNTAKSPKSSKRISSKSKSDKKIKDRAHRSNKSRSKSKDRSGNKSHKRSRSRSGSFSRSRRRSSSRSRHKYSRSSRHRHEDDKSYRSSRSEHRRNSDRDNRFEIDKKRLLEIARKNAINMLQNGSLPAAVSLGPLAQQKVISAIKSGGKSVDELTDFCKNLSRQEALGELSSVSEDSDNSDLPESEMRAFHHPFLVKDKAPIVLNIKGGTALPTQSFQEKTMEQSKVLRLQFPVSSGSQHRGAEGEWRPVSPSAQPAPPPSALPPLPKHIPNPPLIKFSKTAVVPVVSSTPVMCPPPELALPPPPVVTQYAAPSIPTPIVPGMVQPPIVPAAPPGPQVFPAEANKIAIDIGSIVSQRLTAIRKLQQNPNDIGAISQMYQVNKEMSKWAQSKQEPGQFTGSTGAQILTPRELASGYQAWAKRASFSDRLHIRTRVPG